MSFPTRRVAQGIRRRTLANEIVPALCGSAFKNKGVQAFLDAIVEFLPAPNDVPPIRGISDDKEGTEVARPSSDDAPFAALAFKIATDPFVGTVTFFRVYSGVLNSGDTVYNPIKQRKERIGRILQMHANHREEINEVRAGDIAAAVGLKAVTTGETLCDAREVITLERMDFPEPVIAVAVEPKTKVDQEKMGLALGKLAHEDPSFRVRTDAESGQTIISGMGELHLEIIVDRLKREFKVEANVGKPQVAYRETIRETVEQEGKFVRQSGGRGQYGHVWLRIEPTEPGEGYEFVDQIDRWRSSKGIHPRRGQGCGRANAEWGHRRLPGRGRESHALRRVLPRCGLQRDGLQDRGLDGLQARRGEGKAGFARAHHESGSRDARRLHGRCDGRPQPPPRYPPGHGGLARG